MKIYIVVLLLLVSGPNKVFCQRLADFPNCGVLDEINVLHHKTVWGKPFGPSAVFDSLDFITFNSLDFKLDTMLAALNYSNQVNKYFLGRYYLQQGNKDKAVMVFKEIMRFPFWGQYEDMHIDNRKIHTVRNSFFEIYWKSGAYLIEALSGNLEELNKLEFVPSSHGYLIGRLRSAIEKAGGVWTKGDTNFPLQDNDLKNFENHIKKQKNEK